MLTRLTYLWNATFCGPFFKSYLGEIDFTFYIRYDHYAGGYGYRSPDKGLS